MNPRSLLLCALLFPTMTGVLCAGDTLHTRGWIGGEYALAKRPGFFRDHRTVQAFPSSLRQEQKAGIFARFVPAGSPAAQAGLQAGDLILRLDDQPVEKLGRFHDLVESLEPGQSVRLTLWRAGEKRQITVVAGREIYRNIGTIGFGLFFSPRLDLWPNPDFSLFVVSYQSERERAQLHSTEAEYHRAVRKADGTAEDDSPDDNPDNGPDGEPDDDGHADGQGWNCWVTPFNLGFHERILTQEPAVK